MNIKKITRLPAGEAISYIWKSKLYPIQIHQWYKGRLLSSRISFNRHGRIEEFPMNVENYDVFSIDEDVPIDEDTRFNEGFYTMKFKYCSPSTLRLTRFNGHSLNSLKEVLKVHDELVTGFYLPNGHDIVQIWNDKEGFLTDKIVIIDEIHELIRTN